MTPEQIWNAALGELELELSKAKFITWLEHTSLLDCNNGSAVVGVPDTFTKTWLENKYHHYIVKALRRISRDEINMVQYRVCGKINRPAAIKKIPVQAISVKKNNEAGTNGEKVVANQQSQPLPNINIYNDPNGLIAAGLNSRYTFENFIIGKKNELAHAACSAVAKQLGEVYNPLFIYGGVGLGKTHLMQAVGHIVYSQQKKVLYVPCETFTNEYIDLVRKGQANKFMEKYRSVDLLMVDDIQFLGGKEGTQEAFFHTFNHLHRFNKQIILTADRPPRAIPALEQRLLSRFEGGMIVDVHTPDLETRIAILKQRCLEKNIDLPNDAAQFIASNIQNNVRELEGALNRVVAHLQLQKNIELTAESVKQVLSSYTQLPQHGSSTPQKIIQVVAEYYSLPIEELCGSARRKEALFPRQIAIYLMREETHIAFTKIGELLDGRDHTTMMHSYQKIASLIEADNKVHADVALIKQRLYNS